MQQLECALERERRLSALDCPKQPRPGRTVRQSGTVEMPAQRSNERKQQPDDGTKSANAFLNFSTSAWSRIWFMSSTSPLTTG